MLLVELKKGLAGLGVRSRDEVTRLGFEYSRGFLPGLNDCLLRRFPSQRLEVLGKVKSAHESEHMRFQALQVRVMKSLDGGFFDRVSHPLGLPICPRVIRSGQLVHDAVFIANPAKDVHS